MCDPSVITGAEREREIQTWTLRECSVGNVILSITPSLWKWSELELSKGRKIRKKNTDCLTEFEQQLVSAFCALCLVRSDGQRDREGPTELQQEIRAGVSSTGGSDFSPPGTCWPLRPAWNNVGGALERIDVARHMDFISSFSHPLHASSR